ncbi:hypothetical protein DDF62_17045 [Caulobacter radicis]|uniref:HlyD family secretion protein n=1 Tax=Caulobacter radicis TaxID=2172650 RepID=UPI000D571FB3|nr:HlyD family efflux transporter periplasmic adaptor subunit [Caulobacter radicis]PVM86763.1 hypothetical protein DDF62_17045 [Caulobacter radicis]
MGAPTESVGVRNWVLTTFLIIVAVTVAAFAGAARYDRVEVADGELRATGGAADILSFRPGIVSGVLVEEGEEVKVGQPIVALVLDTEIRSVGRSGDAVLTTLDEQLAGLARQSAARRGAAENQNRLDQATRAGLLAQSGALKASRTLQEQRIALAQRGLDALKGLGEQGLVSAVQVRQREEALLVAKQDLAAIDKELSQIPSSLTSLDAEAARARDSADQDLAALDVKRAELNERKISAQGEAGQLLSAPIGGQVTGLQAKPGDAVSSGQAIATVVSGRAGIEARLWVTSKAIGFVRPGDPVRLKYAAYPYAKFGVASGVVKAVAKAPSSWVASNKAAADQEARFQIIVSLADQTVSAYGRQWPLTAGMKVQGEVILQRQSLMDWLFENLKTTTGAGGK